MFPMFAAAFSFGTRSSKRRLLPILFGTCENANPPGIKHCERFFSEWLPGITDLPPLNILNAGDPYWDALPNDGRLACFPKLVAGTAHFGLWSVEAFGKTSSSLGCGRIYQRLRDTVADAIIVAPRLPETSIKVLILDAAKFNRVLRDPHALQRALAGRSCGPAVVQDPAALSDAVAVKDPAELCDVAVQDPAALSAKQQLVLTAQTSVMITASGGGSFLAMFLPKGATHYKGHNYIEHNYIGHDYSGHNHVGQTYIVMAYVVMAYRCRRDLFGNGRGRPRARPRLDRRHSLQTLLHADASQRHVVAVSQV